MIYTFSGFDGGWPSSSVIEDNKGRLYGTTQLGGNTGGGVVYRLTPPVNSGGTWTEEVLYNFYQSGADGASPVASLIFDHMGALYGTTSGGGGSKACGAGCGTVFRLSPPSVPGGAWTESVLYAFAGSPNDGAIPEASLILDSAGSLYGTTASGGDNSGTGCYNNGCGTAFRLSPPSTLGGAWTEQVLHTFTGGNDGGVPLANLILDDVGNLYGTTSEGGQLGNGAVFKLAPPAAQNDT